MHPAYLRELYGSQFATVLPDGQEVVWRPLTVGEFIEYDRLMRAGRYPLAYIENEIFKKCVQNSYLVENIDTLPAGIVSAVSTTIIQYSGPQNLEELAYLLNNGRAVSEEILHQMVVFICWAFPAYKPEDVYAMSYETIMLRLAQAENKLARTGMITEPFTFFKPEDQAKQKEPGKKPTEDLLLKYYEQQGMVDPRTGKTPQPTKRTEPAPKPRSSAPVKPDKPTIVTSDDIKEHQMAYVGHEMEDRFLLEHSMVEKTAPLYREYAQQFDKDGKIKFKSMEERKAEYLARVKQTAERIAKIDAARSEEDKKLMETFIKEQTAKKERKKEKANKKNSSRRR